MSSQAGQLDSHMHARPYDALPALRLQLSAMLGVLRLLRNKGGPPRGSYARGYARVRSHASGLLRDVVSGGLLPYETVSHELQNCGKQRGSAVVRQVGYTSSA